MAVVVQTVRIQLRYLNCITSMHMLIITTMYTLLYTIISLHLHGQRLILTVQIIEVFIGYLLLAKQLYKLG